MRLNLDQLETFAEVVELGSFSLAARHLNLTQPAVSLRVKQLERHFGIKLVERAGRRTRATAAGRILYERIHKIDMAVADAMNALADYHSDTRGRVLVGTFTSVCIHLLPPVLRRLRQRYPGLELVIRTGNSRSIMEWIEDGSVDVALVSLTGAHQNLHAVPIATDELVVLPPEAQTRRLAHFTPQDLSGKPLILPAAGDTYRLIKSWFDDAHIACRPAMEVNNIEARRRLAEARLGYAIVPRMIFSEREKAPYYRLLPRLYRTLNVVVRQDKLLSHGVREVMSALQRIGDEHDVDP